LAMSGIREPACLCAFEELVSEGNEQQLNN